MNICFYVENIRNNLDFSVVEDFNPGIGGTQYLFLALAQYLARNSSHKIHLLSNTEITFDLDYDYCCVKDIKEAIEKCASLKYDLMVIRGPIYDNSIALKLEKFKVKAIVWSHNFESYNCISLCGKCENIIKYVCVSQEQRDLLLDTCLYEKSCIIWNSLNFKKYPSSYNMQKKKRICYIGNLYPKSGYDKLALAWSKIEKEFPESELYIIGGNKLYTQESFDGRYSKKSIQKLNKIVEKAFFKDGRIKDNVHFTGVLGGKEKLEIMRTALVGVANLTETGETFGLSLIEFEALGVPVVSINYRGTRETVKDKQTGLLVNKKDLAEGIIKLLKDDMVAKKMGESARTFVEQNFSINEIGKQWSQLFDDMQFDSLSTSIEIQCERYRYDFKRPILLNYYLKKIPFLSWLPPVAFYRYVKEMTIRIFEKLNMI